MRNGIKLRLLGCIVFMMVLAVSGGHAHAYGGGGGGGGGGDGGGGGGDVGGSGQDSGFGPLSQADLIRAFGTPAQKEELERSIKEAQDRLKQAEKMAEIKRKQLNLAKKKLRELEQEIRDGDNSMEKESEYFNMWKKLTQKQNEFLKQSTEAIVAGAELGRAEEGDDSLTQDQRDRLRDTFNKDADAIRKEATERMLEALLQHSRVAINEADAHDRNMQRAEMVKWVAVAGGVVVGGVGAATLTTAQAAKLLLISTTLDAAGAGIGAAADSQSKGHSVTETVVRSMSAATLQAVAGKVLGKVPSTNSATADALVEFAKAYGVDALQNAMADLDTSKSAPTSAPNYSPGVPTQQHHR